MRNNYLILPVLLATACLPRVGLSDESTAGISVGQLSAVQSETNLYKAQAERAKALRELGGEGQLSAQPGPYSYEPSQVRPNSEESLPVVKLVYGSSRALRATLLYSSGIEVDAQAGGHELPGGYKVGSISLDSVVLTRAGKRYPLGFASSVPANTYPGVSNRMPAPGLPGIPMGQPAPVSTQ